MRQSCGACGSTAVSTAELEQLFQYGTGDDAVELMARVPVHTCTDCGFEFTDGTAEDIRHAAVCAHLGVLTPEEIQKLRQETMAVSRETFSELTGIGTASLARWESGQVIQNVGYDKYLRLLHDPEVVLRLRRLAEGLDPAPAGPTVRTFPSLDTPERDRHAAGEFQLRRAG